MKEQEFVEQLKSAIYAALHTMLEETHDEDPAVWLESLSNKLDWNSELLS
jgi:hypothetical protein